MSRSRRAALLARYLTEVTATTNLELAYYDGPRWDLNWTDGPLDEEMRAHLDAALAGHRYAEMRDRTIARSRSYSQRARAARAIASRRERTPAPAPADGAARRRTGHGPPVVGTPDPGDTHERYALLDHIKDLRETTSYPQRASAPEDEPLIEQLLAAGTTTNRYTGHPVTSKYDMARALLAAEQAPATDTPPRLTTVPTTTQEER